MKYLSSCNFIINVNDIYLIFGPEEQGHNIALFQGPYGKKRRRNIRSYL